MSARLLSTRRHAAGSCGVSQRTVLRWVTSGKLPAKRTPGGHWRIATDDLRVFIPPALQNTHDAGAPRIAIVLEVVHEARALRRLLLSLLPNAVIDIAPDSFAAGLLLADTQPDLAFFDFELAGIDGIDVAARICTMSRLKRMRLIAVVGRIDPAQRTRLDNFTVHEVWDKPIAARDVVELIDRYQLDAEARQRNAVPS